MSEFLSRAFSAHANVKARLRRVIAGEEAADPETIRSDCLCEVGRWIYGEGTAAYEAIPEFQNLKRVHAEFHEAAYQALMLHRSGRTEQAVSSIETGTFQVKSQEIGLAIMSLKNKVSV